MKLFLASKIEYCLNKISILLDKPFCQTKVIFIPTASILSDDKTYVESDLNCWQWLWFKIKVLCLEKIESNNVLNLKDIEDADIIYFSWWNTFLLLDKIKKLWFDRLMKKLMIKWKIFAWSSAWASIMWPNIYPAHNIDDVNVVETNDYLWLNFIDYFLIPHFDVLEMTGKAVKIIKDCENMWIKYKTLNENQCIIVNN